MGDWKDLGIMALAVAGLYIVWSAGKDLGGSLKDVFGAVGSPQPISITMPEIKLPVIDIRSPLQAGGIEKNLETGIDVLKTAFPTIGFASDFWGNLFRAPSGNQDGYLGTAWSKDELIRSVDASKYPSKGADWDSPRATGPRFPGDTHYQGYQKPAVVSAISQFPGARTEADIPLMSSILTPIVPASPVGRPDSVCKGRGSYSVGDYQACLSGLPYKKGY